VEDQVIEVIEPRLEPGDREIQGQGQPRQGDPVTGMKVREHPSQIGKAQAMDGRIEEDVRVIIPTDELILGQRPIG